MQKTYIIIGTSAAGIAAARTLRNLDKESHIICCSDEQEQPYNKCYLADYIHQSKSEQEVYTLLPEQAAALNIKLQLGVSVTNIVSDNATLMLSSGESIHYDALLIATGTRPIVPAVKGLDRVTNAFAFHGLHDVARLQRYIVDACPQRAVVIGAGLSGLEAADALAARGIKVTVIERSGHLLSRHIPCAGADFIEKIMQRRGIMLRKHISVDEIRGNNGIATTVLLSDASEIKTDMIVYAVGLRPNIELVRGAGIATSAHGILVDEYMQTSCPNIYAAGDVIAVQDTLSGQQLASCTWPDAMQQGMHAAYAMVGKPKAYRGACVLVSSAFFGFKFHSCGPDPKSGAYEVIEQQSEDYYHRYVLLNGILKGFCLIGNTVRYAQLRRAVMSGELFTI